MSDEWDLLSPRYFSNVFVSLFDGGPLTFIALFILLFFGTLILPAIVELRKRQLKKRAARKRALQEEESRNGATVEADTSTRSRRRYLPIEKAPPYIRGERMSYAIFYYMSLGLGIIYFVAHLAISFWPTRFLIAGEQLQWLAADDVRALIQFLYRWVLTGYALAVLSIALGLDYLARWMNLSWPIVVTSPAQSAVPPTDTIAPPPDSTNASLIDLSTAISRQSFLIETFSGENRGRSENKLIYDPGRIVCVSHGGQIEYDNNWPSGENEMKRLLSFRSMDHIWYAFFELHHSENGTAVSYYKKDDEKGELLDRALPLNNDVIEFRWTRNDVQYYCKCTRYIQL